MMSSRLSSIVPLDAGCDIFRIFDALNDPENLRTAVRCVIASGRHARGEICYTQSPVHTLEKFIAFGRELAEMGCHSLAIKDMSGVLPPVVAGKLVSGLKKATGLGVTVHSHDTAGLAAATYLAAIDADAESVETSIAPFANGTALGKFGRNPGPVDAEVLKLATKLSNQEPVTANTSSLLPPGMPSLREKVAEAGLPVTDESCVLFAMFPQQTTAWFRGERTAPKSMPAPPPPSQTTPAIPPAATVRSVRRMTITVGGITREATVETLS